LFVLQYVRNEAGRFAKENWAKFGQLGGRSAEFGQTWSLAGQKIDRDRAHLWPRL
jgi:hypothetical protein